MAHPQVQTLGSAILPSRFQACELAFHREMSGERAPIESFIKAKYYDIHQAELEGFLPLLLGVVKHQVPVCAVGLRPGQHRPMFLEQYLDAPIEQLVATVCHQPVERCGLVEIGNLAISEAGLGPLLMTLMASALEKSGFEWMVFTVTTHVEKLIRRLGFNPIYLAHAHEAKLRSDASCWGRYYENNPKVMVGKLKIAVDVIENNALLSSIAKAFEPEISAVALQLRAYRHALKSTR